MLPHALADILGKLFRDIISFTCLQVQKFEYKRILKIRKHGSLGLKLSFNPYTILTGSAVRIRNDDTARSIVVVAIVLNSTQFSFKAILRDFLTSQITRIFKDKIMSGTHRNIILSVDHDSHYPAASSLSRHSPDMAS